MASGMVHGFVRDADRESRVWLKVNASPACAATEKRRDAHPENPVVGDCQSSSFSTIIRPGLAQRPRSRLCERFV